ncbi:MAG: hypothetical protein K0Q49_175 [Haloplasmataceae bacterium]|jgi:hypothetical protein|nr:hypothetical protein [Haloplasmataceae bacterium]
MSRKEKYLYQENRLGYSLVILFILINAVNAIVELNNMSIDKGLGITVFVNIIISLVTFLSAVKIKKYFINWTYFTFLLGLLQFYRIKFVPIETAEKVGKVIFFNFSVNKILITCLITSGILAIIGALISFRKCIIRKRIIKRNLIKV